MSSKIQVVADENITVLEELETQGVKVHRMAGRSIARKHLEHADALMVRSVTKVDAALLEGTPVKWVGSATAGVNHVDTRSLLDNGISFCYAPGSNAMSVAEYVLFFATHWCLRNSLTISGMTIGIVGFGNIGTRVAALFHQLGCTVLYYDPFVHEPPKNMFAAESLNISRCKDLRDLIGRSDIVSLHVPLSQTGEHATANMVDAEELRCFKKDALLIHTCRGGVVRETALLDYMQKSQLTVVADVWEHEPIVRTDLAGEVWYGTPHIAGYSYDGKVAGARVLFRTMCEFFNIPYESDMPEHQHRRSLNSFLSGQQLDLEELVHHIDHSRQLLSDAASFKQLLDLADNERGKAFDSMRKSYPKRFESLTIEL